MKLHKYVSPALSAPAFVLSVFFAAPSLHSQTNVHDFGTDGTKWAAPTDGFEYNFGGPSTVRTYAADSVSLAGTAVSGFKIFGSGFGGNFNSQDTLIGATVSAASDQFLRLEGSFNAPPTANIFAVRVTLVAAGGAGSSTWAFDPAAFNTNGVNSVVLASTSLASPFQVSGAGFTFGSSILDQIQVLVQNGDTAGNFSFTIDQISIAAIPEPSTYSALAAVAIFGIAVTRRRRSA